MPDELLAHYFKKMVDRVFKILPLKQDGEDTLQSYLDSLLTELLGVDILTSLSTEPYYASLLGTIAYLNKNINDCDCAKVKKEVFGAIKICNALADQFAKR